MNRGEVWWVQPQPGTRRPYLIITRQIAIELLNSVIAVPATRTVRGIPTEVELDQGDGMPEQCALALDNLTLVPKDDFATLICELSADRMRAVCTALGEAVDCDP